jgi:hypothetical protein
VFVAPLMKQIKIPPMLPAVVQNAFAGVDDLIFTIRYECYHCGGPVRYHDIRKKRFATIMEDGDKRTIFVQVYRYYCRHCGKLCYAEAPFYPDTKFGSPVIDLCITLSQVHPYNHTAKILNAMGIIVDRGTIRNFSERNLPRVSYAKMYDLPIPLSIFYLSDLVSKSNQRNPLDETDVMKACGFLPSWEPRLQSY